MTAATDIELLEASRSGDVDAFGQIVARYQSVVCAVALSATGSVALSEEVAQETFLTAWLRLGSIEHPDKLRGWICGVARNLSRNTVRRARRETPEEDLATSGTLAGQLTELTTPLDNALDRETEQIVWRALERVPARYREPLILYYREDKSSRQVAEALGLSEAAVDQRLSRGRRYLRKSVAQTVERGLRRSKPAAAFTAAVLAAIAADRSLAGPRGSTRAAGATAATSSALKGALVVTAACAVLVGIGAGVWFSVDSETPQDVPAELVASRETLERLKGIQGAMAAQATHGVTSVRGRVMDTEGKAIVGADVVVTPAELDGGARNQPGHLPRPSHVRSESGGTWHLKDVPPGIFHICTTALGYAPSCTKKRVTIHKPQQIETAVLVPGGRVVTGEVHDVGGGEVGGALVAVYELLAVGEVDGRPPLVGSVTDDAGRFRLSVGSWASQLRVSHPDYVELYRDLRAAAAMHDGELRDLRLVPSGTVEGRVVAAGSGTPVPGALVSAWSEGGRFSMDAWRTALLDTVATDSEGHFTLHGLASGSVLVSAGASGLASVQPVVVELSLAEQAHDVIVELTAAVDLRGFVVDATGEPLADALVALRSVERQAQPIAFGGGFGRFSADEWHAGLAAAPSGADGAFEINGVLPGRYTMNVDARRNGEKVVAEPITVSQQDIADLVVTIEEGVTLRGRVEPSLPGVVGVALTPDPSWAPQDMMRLLGKAARIDAEGTFVLTGMPTGRFELLAKTREGLSGRLAVEVGETSMDGLRIPVEAHASILGSVSDQLGHPLPGVHVVANSLGQMRSFAIDTISDEGWTDRAGRFELSGLAPGRYAVSVQRPHLADPAVTLLPWHGSAVAESNRPQTVVIADEPLELDLRVVLNDAIIGGEVVDRAGVPVPDAWVVAVWPRDADPTRIVEHEASRPVLTGATGDFQLGGLLPGAYNVVATGPNGKRRGRATDVSTGSEPVRVTLEDVASLEVSVRDNGKAVPAFELRIDGLTPRRATVRDQTGRHRLDRLEAGRYSVSVTAGQRTASTEIEVIPGEVTRCELALVDRGVVTGRLVAFADGKPLAGVVVVPMPEEDATAMFSATSTTQTLVDGSFRIERLQPGTRTLMLMHLAMPALPPIRIEVPRQGGSDLATIRLRRQRLPDTERGQLGVVLILAFGCDTEEGSAACPSPTGALVVHQVVDGMAAADAGVRDGDRIARVDQTRIEESGADGLLAAIRPRRGQTVTLELLRGEERLVVEPIARAPSAQPPP